MIGKRARRLTSRSDGLPVLLILHVTCGENARNAGLGGAGRGDQVSVLVHLELVLEQVSRGVVADGVEEAVGGDLLGLAGLVVLDDHALHEAARAFLALDLDALRVVAHLDFGVGGEAARVGLACAQNVAADKHGDLAGLLGQVDGLLDRGVAAADHDERLLAENGQAAVAHGAGAHAVAPEFVLAGEIEAAGLGTRGDNDAVRRVRLLLQVLVVAHGVEPVLERSLGEVDLADGLGDDLGAAGLALRAHLVHERRALDHLEAGEVLDLVGGGELAAGGDSQGEETLVHDGLEVGAGGVDGGGVASGAGADDDDLGVHVASLVEDLGGGRDEGGGGGGVVESGRGGGCGEGQGDGGAKRAEGSCSVEGFGEHFGGGEREEGGGVFYRLNAVEEYTKNVGGVMEGTGVVAVALGRVNLHNFSRDFCYVLHKR